MKIYRVYFTDINDKEIYIDKDFSNREKANEFIQNTKIEYSDATVIELILSEDKTNYKIIDIFFNN